MSQLIAILVALLNLSSPYSPPSLPPSNVGIAKYYSAGRFLDVLDVRQSQGYPVHYNNGNLVAHYDCSTIGKFIYFQLAYPNNTYGPVQRAQQIDCAMPQHLRSQRTRGLILEVPYWMARDYRFLGGDCKNKQGLTEHGCTEVRILRIGRN